MGRSAEISGKDSPRRGYLRTAFAATNQARIYPEDREGTSLFDAAGYWGVSKAGADSVLNRVEERRHALESSLSSPKRADNDDPLGAPNRLNTPEGGLMPFDMDVPVAYGTVAAGSSSNLQIGITDITTGAVVSTTSRV